MDVSLPAAKVLLVEDEEMIREIVAELLSDEGFDVTATCTGDEAAVLLAEDAGFDVLLTDVTMPGRIDGIGLAQHAREVNPALPVVFVSGRPDSEQRARRLTGLIAFFGKPYDFTQLISTVSAFARA